jgi:epsin
LSQDSSSQQLETDILADILPPAPLPEITAQHNSSPSAFGQPSPSFSTSSGPFSEPTGQLTQPGFSAAASQPAQTLPTSQYTQQGFSATTSPYAQQPFPSHSGQPAMPGFSSSTGHSMQPPFASQGGQSTAQSSGHTYGGLYSLDTSLTPGAPNMYSQSQNGYNGSMNSGNYLPQGSSTGFPSHMTPQAPTAQQSQITNFPHHGGPTASSPTDQASQLNNQSFFGQQGNAAPFSSSYTQQVPAPSASPYAVSMTSNALVAQPSNALVSQPSKDKFETKSTVWADTLSRGLVNLNISGRKCLYLVNTSCL